MPSLSFLKMIDIAPFVFAFGAVPNKGNNPFSFVATKWHPKVEVEQVRAVPEDS